MSTELAKAYEPKTIQPKWLQQWHAGTAFHANPGTGKKPHTIMIPLPNVTGALHMGHCLNGTLQDLVTRYRRMQGCEALWMPGTDHAGIATQAVVERRMLEEEKLTRHDVGRDALVKRIWKWKDEYEKRILNQLKELGASCDWRRTRFTLDDVCSKAVRRTFFKMFSDRLIYRGKRLVNWDTYLQTAVADDEVTPETVKGHFWTFTYPVVGQERTIAFSTTRPETMLGDTAVAVHPEDERYADLVGKLVRIPVNGREIPIIADGQLVDRTLGTGVVKVTPAHDPNDYACGIRHKLPMINILNPDGTINELGGKFAGQDRYKVRELIVEEMRAAGHFVSVEDRDIELKHSDRSKTPVEPYLSEQWFVKMEELAENAMQAVRDGRVKFFPGRYTKTYLDWLGEKRDWCISRQLWWGHQIPVWSMQARDSLHIGAMHERFQFLMSRRPELWGSVQWRDGRNGEFGSDEAQKNRMLICLDAEADVVAPELEQMGFVRDEAVLDTWFSSALWPHATLGWPDTKQNPPLRDGADPAVVPGENAVLKTFYPGSVLITSRDIITLWVARMVITGLYNMGDVPFAHVHVHPKILDGFGQTMSKSKGNGVDPVDLFDKYGVDAVRFTIASLAGENQDVKLPVGYECPSCGEVIPQTLEQQTQLRNGAKKLVLKCAKCKAQSQYLTQDGTGEEGVPTARVVSERFDYGRNFCNKLWNAARFTMMNLEGYTPGAVKPEELRIEDRWILSRLATTANTVTAHLNGYEFDAATRLIREFTWNEFCDWYLEMIKPRLRDAAARPVAQRLVAAVLDGLLRLLSPFTPFVCEELWERLGQIAPERGLMEPTKAAELCMLAPWPEVPQSWRDPGLEQRFQRLQDTIVAVRNVRAVYGIDSKIELSLYIRCQPEVAGDLQTVAAQFENLSRAVLKAAGLDVERPSGSASFSLVDADAFIPLKGIVDREAELKRQQKEAEKLKGFIAGHSRKLANESFVAKAPPEVVAEVRATLAGLEGQLASVQEIIKQLSED